MSDWAETEMAKFNVLLGKLLVIGDINVATVT